MNSTMLGGVPYRAAVLFKYILLIRLLYRVSIVTGPLPLNTLNIQADIDFPRATEECICFSHHRSEDIITPRSRVESVG